MKAPPVWNEEELDQASQRAEEHFRESRHTEPLEVYLELFDEYQGIVEEVMEETVDLTLLEVLIVNVTDPTAPVKRFALSGITGPARHGAATGDAGIRRTGHKTQSITPYVMAGS